LEKEHSLTQLGTRERITTKSKEKFGERLRVRGCEQASRGAERERHGHGTSQDSEVSVEWCQGATHLR